MSHASKRGNGRTQVSHQPQTRTARSPRGRINKAKPICPAWHKPTQVCVNPPEQVAASGIGMMMKAERAPRYAAYALGGACSVAPLFKARMYAAGRAHGSRPPLRARRPGVRQSWSRYRPRARTCALRCPCPLMPMTARGAGATRSNLIASLAVANQAGVAMWQPWELLEFLLKGVSLGSGLLSRARVVPKSIAPRWPPEVEFWLSIAVRLAFDLARIRRNLNKFGQHRP